MENIYTKKLERRVLPGYTGLDQTKRVKDEAKLAEEVTQLPLKEA